MSERGVFAVDRGIWDHPSFANEPLTEREAWQWLIGEASFKARTKRVGSSVVQLDRGQVAASLRFMADKWQWSEPRVRRFLKRLKTDAMIDAQTDAGITVITICNYNKYQKVSLPRDAVSDAPNDAGATQERRKVEDTKSTEVVDGGGSARAKLISDEAQETADALATACGFPDPKNCPIGWYGAAAWVQKCFNEGWPAELMIEAAKETAKRKRDGPIEHFKYLEKPLAKAIAEHARPLPKVEFLEAETVVSHGRSSGRYEKAQSLSDVARRHAEEGISFGERPATPSLRSITGGADVRLLPQSGGK